MDGLPEKCVANILGLTTPIDVCTLAALSTTFRSAADSDVVWERFLPSDYASMISDSSDPSLLTRFPSKKQLFFKLCESPLLLHDATMTLQLDRKTSKKLYMFSASALELPSPERKKVWGWINQPESRFTTVAILRGWSKLKIKLDVNTSILSSETCYAAYLVFKLSPKSCGFDYHPLSIRTSTLARRGRVRGAYLAFIEGTGVFSRIFDNPTDAYWYDAANAQLSRRRKDGWLEVKLGEMYNAKGGDLFKIDVHDYETEFLKRGLVIEGIEIRPCSHTIPIQDYIPIEDFISFEDFDLSQQ